MEVINSLNPCSLVMTKGSCFYCNKNDNSVKMFCIERLFGMKACSDHYANAEKDIYRYYKENNKINIKDAMKNEDIKQFIDYLGDNIKVIRSNGFTPCLSPEYGRGLRFSAMHKIEHTKTTIRTGLRNLVEIKPLSELKTPDSQSHTFASPRYLARSIIKAEVSESIPFSRNNLVRDSSPMIPLVSQHLSNISRIALLFELIPIDSKMRTEFLPPQI